MDWNRSFLSGSFDIYIPEHVGPKSVGEINNLARNADGTVTLKAAFGAADPKTGRTVTELAPVSAGHLGIAMEAQACA